MGWQQQKHFRLKLCIYCLRDSLKFHLKYFFRTVCKGYNQHLFFFFFLNNKQHLLSWRSTLENEFTKFSKENVYNSVIVLSFVVTSRKKGAFAFTVGLMAGSPKVVKNRVLKKCNPFFDGGFFYKGKFKFLQKFPNILV